MTKVMSHGLDLVQSIFSSLSALILTMLTCPELITFDIKICHNQCKLVSANQRRSFIGVIKQNIFSSRDPLISEKMATDYPTDCLDDKM